MRIALRVAAGVLALGLVALLGLLVPAHWQTRRITPPLPDVEALRSLGDAQDGPVRVEVLTTASQVSSRGILGHTVVLVTWADGRTFMIDAGMDRAAAAEFAVLLQWMWGADEGRFHGDVAEQLGPEIADVRAVGFTHLHIDHSQGVIPFCAARGTGATAVQTRWQAQEHNFNTTEGAQTVAGSCLAPRVLDEAVLVEPDGFPGLGVVALGGHTPGSTLFAVAVDGHLWLFSGDTTNTKAALLDDEPKPFWYSGLAVPENTTRTAELRAWLAGLDALPDMTVIVSHDLDDLATSGLAMRGILR